jgi:hypothetical protein
VIELVEAIKKEVGMNHVLIRRLVGAAAHDSRLRTPAQLAMSMLKSGKYEWWAIQDALNEEAGREVKVIARAKGDKIMVQTVTYFWTGEVIDDDFAQLSIIRATCIFDTGNLEEFFKSGTAQSSEKLPVDYRVSFDHGPGLVIVDWKHKIA